MIFLILLKILIGFVVIASAAVMAVFLGLMAVLGILLWSAFRDMWKIFFKEKRC